MTYEEWKNSTEGKATAESIRKKSREENIADALRILEKLGMIPPETERKRNEV